MKNIFFVTLIFALAGCASTPSGDFFTEFKAPAEGMSQLYLYRPPKYEGQALKYKVFVDGVDTARIGDSAYIVLPLTPGKHEIELKALAYTKNPQEFDFPEGENIYITALTDFKRNFLGGKAKVILNQIVEEVAAAELTNMRLDEVN